MTEGALLSELPPANSTTPYPGADDRERPADGFFSAAAPREHYTFWCRGNIDPHLKSQPCAVLGLERPGEPARVVFACGCQAVVPRSSLRLRPRHSA
jgi:hypothetical protein